MGSAKANRIDQVRKDVTETLADMHHSSIREMEQAEAVLMNYAKSLENGVAVSLRIPQQIDQIRAASKSCLEAWRLSQLETPEVRNG